MLPLGFRFDLGAVILDGTAHTADCVVLPVTLPPGAVRLDAGETYHLGTLSSGIQLRAGLRDAAELRPRGCHEAFNLVGGNGTLRHDTHRGMYAVERASASADPGAAQ